MKKNFNLHLNTPPEDYCKEEINKFSSRGLRDPLFEDLRGGRPDMIWEAEQIAKSHGIYLEYNRAKTGSEKDWIYMIRFSIPAGGPVSAKQWLLFDELSEHYGRNPEGQSSFRLTTRQNIQFHWIKKNSILPIIKTLAEHGRNSINGCGDNTRNVTSCPLSHHSDLFNAAAWAHRVGEYFQLPLDPFIEIFSIDPACVQRPTESFQYGPYLLNRKFKIGFSTLHRDQATGRIIPDNCTEVLTDDVGIVPVCEDGVVTKFQIYLGGGQGERNGKPSLACLAQPFAVVADRQLLPALDAIVKVHQRVGDRQNRHFARLKFVIQTQGIPWYREHVQALLVFPLGEPIYDLDYGRRDLHHGWHVQPNNKLLTFGAFIENGRVIDHGPNGEIKTMIRELVSKYPVELMITPNQDLLFTNIPPGSKSEFEADLLKYGYGQRHGKPYSRLRTLSGACVGRDTCRLTYTDSEKFEPLLIDELEQMGWADLAESIGITGCERQCFRPATKSIGLVGSGLNRYQFIFFGDESARFQGTPLLSSDGEKLYLRSVPRERVAGVMDALFKWHQSSRENKEGLGAFFRRVGPDAIICHLKETPAVADLMEKFFEPS